MRYIETFLGVLVLAAIATGQDKPRVFVTDSNSWEMSGGFGGNKDGFAGRESGGARPQTVEIMKTFSERCPAVTVTNVTGKADFVILLDHEGGKGLARKDNKVALFSKDGDMIHTSSTRSLGNAVKNACDAITAKPTAASAK